MKKTLFQITKKDMRTFKKTSFLLLKVTLNIFFTFYFVQVAVGQSNTELYSVDKKKSGDGSTLIRQSYLPASVTASAFEIYGQANVNKFTGSPSINIPLFDVSYKDLSVSSGLTYQKGGGIKPNEFPGIVGNGWMFNAGGVITRKSKGLTKLSFPDDMPIPVEDNLISAPDWSSNSKMLLNIQRINLPVSEECKYDEFVFNFNGFSGMFYKDDDGIIHVKSNQEEELKVEMNILSQEVNKEITVPIEEQEQNSPDGAPWINNIYNNGKISIRKNPYSFVLIDSRGNRYTFGGTNESIEFSRTGMSIFDYPSLASLVDNTVPVSWYLTSAKSPNGYEINYVYERGNFYLNNTSSCSNSFTSFTSDAIRPKWDEGLPTATLINSSLINPCYLKKIITPEATVQLYWSLADKQLGYRFRTSPSGIVVDSDLNWKPDDYFCNIYFNGYDDVKNAKNIHNRFPNKLDHFTVSGVNGVLKTVFFNYTEDPLTRLKLKSVQIKGSNNSDEDTQLYRFEYNPIALPDYLSLKTDAYGFFNGNNSLINSKDPSLIRRNFTNPAWRQSYLNSRAVDSTYTQAEVLTKVIYPTGGYTVYKYENNRYGSIVKAWPSIIVKNADDAEILAAGLRIKSITNYDGAADISSQKRYFYKKKYAEGGQLSSGVLSYIPIFYEDFNGHIEAPNYISRYPNSASLRNYSGNLYYQAYSTNPLNPISYTKSGFINYSEVSEVDLDGRHVDTEFKNYDNGYLDRPAINAVYDHKEVSNLWKEDSESSLDLERGQILKETIYDNLNAKKQEISYSYNDDITRFDDNGINKRILKCYANPVMSGSYGVSIRFLATLAFNYYPYLKEKTTTSFENVKTIVNTVKYKYNKNKLLIEQSTTDSEGNTFKNLIKYPTDYTDMTPTEPIYAGIQKLKSVNYISIPVEQSVFKSGINSSQDKLISSSFTTFRTDVPLPYQQYGIEEVIVPGTFNTSFVQNGALLKDSRYKLQGQIDQYDVSGNVIQRTKINAPHEVYLWGINKNYLIAEIKNATYNEVSVADLEVKDLYNYGKLKPAVTIKYITDETAPMGNLVVDLQNQSGVIHTSGLSLKADKSYILSYWGKGPEFVPNSQNDQINIISNRVIRRQGDWIQREVVFDHVSGELKFTFGSYGLIQDVKIYPKGAAITTYSHKALVGMTSTTDFKGQTTYYGYDNLLRLKDVKDQNKNIVKAYSYNYRDATVGNQTLSSFFRKAGCPVGHTGERIQYSVPANKYYGKNQQIANAMAYKELNLKGQENANSKGACLQDGIYIAVCSGESRTEVIGDYAYTYVNYYINAYSDNEGRIPSNLSVNVSFRHRNSVQSVTFTSSLNLGEFELYREYVGPMLPENEGEIIETLAPVILASPSYVILENTVGCGSSEIEPGGPDSPNEGFSRIPAIRFDNIYHLVSYTRAPTQILVGLGSIYSEPSSFNELDPSQIFYSDDSASTIAMDGYYTLLETHPTELRGYKYYHVVNGKLVNVGWAGN